MNILIVLFLLILTTYFGYSMLNLLRIKIGNLFFMIALGFGIGFGTIFLLMGVYSILGIHWDALSIFPPVFFISIVSFAFSKSGTLKIIIPRLSKKSTATLFLIVFLAGFVLFESIIRPLSAWDGWSSWQMRAKAMYVDQEITTEQFFYFETEYPLAVPLYSVFIYEMLGEVDDTAILLVSFFFYVMIGLAAFSFLQTKTSTNFALLMTFLVLSTQNLIRHGGRYEAGMADIIMSFFIILAIILLHFVIEKKSGVTLALLFFVMFLTSQIKNEGVVFSSIIFVVILYYAIVGRITRKWLLFFLYMIGVLIWPLLKVIYGLPGGILRSIPIINGYVLLGVVKTQITQYLNIQNWNFGWVYIFTVLTYVIATKKINGVVIVILAQLLVYLIIFLFSSVDPVTHAQGITDRLLIHIFPAATVMFSLYIYPKIKSNRLVN